MKTLSVILAAVLALPCAGFDLSPFGASLDLQTRSVYHSRMRVVEDRQCRGIWYNPPHEQQ